MSDNKWEPVASFLERVTVPGGWIYRSYGHETSVTFVPDPAVWANNPYIWRITPGQDVPLPYYTPGSIL